MSATRCKGQFAAGAKFSTATPSKVTPTGVYVWVCEGYRMDAHNHMQHLHNYNRTQSSHSRYKALNDFSIDDQRTSRSGC